VRTRRERITERENPASASLDRKSTLEILRIINREDRKVAPAVGRIVHRLARAVEMALESLRAGGRIVYLGAGTSGRLGLLDAAECIPTFGTNRVVGVLAGAPRAMFQPVEGIEDDPRQAERDLRKIRLSRRDLLVGISASGQTPYTLGGIRYARRLGGKTVAVTSVPRSKLAGAAHVAIVPVTGPEVITGSTRMKAGTAQKLVLNMLSTASMVRWGRVFSNWMVNLRQVNRKLRGRAEAILMKATGASRPAAARALEASGRDLPVALLMLRSGVSRRAARRLLDEGSDTAAILHERWHQPTASRRQFRKSAVRRAKRTRRTL
jgi:N-acetylmuramic acid 6-phosphate etherase